jgi:hypothetical protein
MRLLFFIPLVLASGCICCTNPFAEESVDTGYDATQATYPPDTFTYTTTTFHTPLSTVLQTTTTTTLALQTTTLQTTSTTTTLKTTTTTQPSFDYSMLGIKLAGCDSDYYGNAIVAGYITNPTDKPAHSVTVVVQLQEADGSVVEDGEQSFTIPVMQQKTTKKFSTVFQKPPAWKRCRAYVKT